MKKWVTLIVLVFFSIGTMYAQKRTVTGKIMSVEDGEPVTGATILVKGTTNGTISGINGDFSITVSNDTKVLTVSYIGMKSVDVSIKNNMVINLEPDIANLEEVIVVAYGKQKKEAITGAVASINSDALDKRPVTSATAALEGQALGVQVHNSYGEPGSEPSIRIRGFNSINGDNSPLYIVNGAPMGGNMSDINPADIESISVLKDASSAALYGNKAANGVILITTKGGRIGDDHLNVQATINQGVYQRGIKEYEKLNPGEYMEAYWMARRNALYTDNSSDKYSTWADANADALEATKDGLVYNIFNKDWAELYDSNGKLTSGAKVLNGYTNDLDWYKPLERNGHRSEYNISANGGSKKASYYVSLGYLNEQGFMKASSGERITGNANINVTPKKWLKFGMTMNGSHQSYNQMTGDSDHATSIRNPFNFSRNMAAIYPVHLHDPETGEYVIENGSKVYDSGTNGELSRPQRNNRHIVWETELDKDRIYRTTLYGTAYADISFLNDFTFTVKGNLDNRNKQNKTYNNSTIGDGAGEGRMKEVDTRYKNYMVQELLNWNHTFNDVHNVEALIGHENYYYNYQYTYIYKTEEKFANIMELTNFNTMNDVEGYQRGYKTEGYFARAGYNYDNKYFVEASFRRDGSSRFYKDNRWGNFWSIGGSWMLSREEFIKQIDWINALKLRAAYGEVGQESSASYYAWMGLYDSDKNGGLGALYKSQIEAKDISWEKAKSLSVALETSAFDRVNFSIEFYNKTSKDLLFDVTLPASIGAIKNKESRPTITKNFGSVSNKGLEINLDGDIIKQKDFVWNLGFNFNFLKNRVEKLPVEYGDEGYIDGTKKFLKGHSRYEFWLYQYKGVDLSDGRALYRLDDKNFYIDEDGYTGPGAKQDEENRTEMSSGNYKIIDGTAYVYKTTYAAKDWSGDVIPDLSGSFNTSVTYKDFRLSGLFTYQLGGVMLDRSYNDLMSLSATPNALHKDVLDSWTPEQTGTGIDPDGTPALNTSLNSDNNAESDRFLISSDYLCIKNITLSYDIPETITRKIDINSITLFGSIENLVTFTKLQGMDPQQAWNGISNNAYVPARVMSIGLNVKF